MSAVDPDILRHRLSLLPVAAPLLGRLAPASRVYLAGGAVRDLMLGHAPQDLDLVIEGELAPVAAALGTVQRAHPRFHTCTVSSDGHRYDLARARTETYPRPGALPVVTPASIDEDLARRDFTVNAFALGLSGPRTGELLSVAHATQDLVARRLRVLHDASFVDDPTRLLRMARYSARLGFTVEPATRRLAAGAVSDGVLPTAGGPRLGAELWLLASELDPVAALRALTPLGLDEALAAGFGLRDDAQAGIAARALALLPAGADRPAVAIAAAALRLDPPALQQLVATLSFGGDHGAVIDAAVRRSADVARRLRAAGRPSEIAAAVRSERVETVALAGAQDAQASARRWLEQLRDVRLAIGGRDLIGAGVSDGPAVGAGLAAALAAKLDGRAPDREAELRAALRAATGAE